MISRTRHGQQQPQQQLLLRPSVSTTVSSSSSSLSLSSSWWKRRCNSSGCRMIVRHAMTVILIVATMVNIAFFTTLDNNHPSNDNEYNNKHKSNNDNIQIDVDININNKEHNNNNKNRHKVLDTFQEAGVRLTDKELAELPTWDDIEHVVGTNGPILHNLQSCSIYRSRIPALERNIGCSGMFNSGTNLVTQLLKANCKIPERVEAYGWDGPFHDKSGKSIGPGEAHGIRWQVPWGKHMPANFRDEHSTKWAKQIWKESVLAVVTIRHPYPWFVSMCKNSYTAKWPHTADNMCPHLRDESNPNELVPVEIKYDAHANHHDSLAHLWNDWYAQYLEKADFPYIVVRFEDLQFFTKNITYQICECAGGKIRTDRPFKYIVDSAKDGPGHGKKEDRTGMLAAWKRYGKPMPPQNGFGTLDYTTAVEHLNSKFMDLFGYKHPEPISGS